MSYYVYIMTNLNNTVRYTGMTNDLARRVCQHRDGEGSIFTKRYQIRKLVYYYCFGKAMDAIAAEKRIKAGSRAKKIELIETMNPRWQDLSTV